MIITKRKGSLEACLMADRGGVLQANLVLNDHSSLKYAKFKNDVSKKRGLFFNEIYQGLISAFRFSE